MSLFRDQRHTYFTNEEYGEVYSSVGKLWDPVSGISADELHIELAVRYDQPCKTKAVVIGNDETRWKIQQVFNQLSPEIHFEGDCGGEIKLLSNQGHFKWFQPHCFEKKLGMVIHNAVAELEFSELIKSISRRTEAKHLTAVYFLDGPRDIWHVAPFARQLGGESPTRKRKPTPLPRLSNNDQEVAISAEDVHWGEKSGEKVTMKEVLFLKFESKKASTDIDAERWFASVEETANDICTAASVGSTSWVQWFRSVCVSANDIKISHREPFHRPRSNYSDLSLIVDRFKGVEYVDKAALAIQKQRADGQDLTMTIVNFLGGKYERFVENQFVSNYLALECLLRLVKRSEVSKRKVDRRFKGKAKDLLSLLSHLDIPWSDLFPDENIDRLVETRNALFHDPGNPDYDRVIIEGIRLETIVARTILKLLDWDDLYFIPSQSNRAYLTAHHSHTAHWTHS